MKISSSFLFKCPQYIRGTLLALVWFAVGTICVFADAPTLTIVQPTEGASFTGPVDVTIEATVIDSGGVVTGVDFYIVGVCGTVQLVTGTAPPYRFTVTKVLSGSYSIYVCSGRSFCSDAVNFSVVGPIQSLVNAAAPGSTVDIPAGVYLDTVVINKDLTLRGTGARSTAIDGNNTCAPLGEPYTFNVRPGPTVTIASGATVTLSGLTVMRGGILNNGTLTVNDCAITGNVTYSGVHNTILGTLLMNNCTVSGNAIQDGEGGGVFNQGTTILNGCTISGNHVGLYEGGSGGGLLNSGTLSLNNCTVTGNIAQGNRYGGGDGGGIGNEPPGTISCKSTIIANNLVPNVPSPGSTFSPDFNGDLNSQGYNLIGNTAGTVISGITTGNLLDIDPLLGPLQDNGGPTDTHALLRGSPAIDAGISGGPNTDQRGFLRPIDIPSVPNAADGSDIGAYEFSGAPTLDISLTPVSTRDQVGTLPTLTATVTTDFPTVGTPVPNTLVTFQVISGPNAGQNGTGTTDANGVASFSNAGVGGVGLDVIQASFVDNQQRIHVSNNVTEDWLSSGSPLAWGLDNFGQLGDGGNPNSYSATPVQVSGLTSVAAIAGGFYSSLALKSDGTVWAWGDGRAGEIGDGNFYLGGVARPIQVSGITGAVAIDCGFYHNLAFKSDGAVWAWGRGFEGQLANGILYNTPPGVATPVQVSGLNNVRAIACGDSHSLALKSDGTVWAWGAGGSGQLGDGNFYVGFYGVATPVQVSGLTTVTAIAGGFGYSLALKSDGTVWAWGGGWSGQLGDGNFYPYPAGVATPVQAIGLSGIVAISGGAGSLALKSDGTVWAWGNGVATPVQVSGFTDAVAIAARGGIALKSDGTVWTLATPPILVSGLTQPVSAIGAGFSCSFALPAVAANTAPVITCPSDVNASNDPVQCSAVVNYPAPLVSGGTGNVVVVCNPLSGSVFPIGTTTVTCTATDGSGATGACSFKVTVNDTEPPAASCAVVKAPVLLSNPPRIVGWFKLLATDNCDSDPLIYIKGSVGSFVAGPFHNGDQVEIAHGPSLIPGQAPRTSGANIASIQLNGDALLWAVDSSGNASTPVKCK